MNDQSRRKFSLCAKPRANSSQGPMHFLLMKTGVRAVSVLASRSFVNLSRYLPVIVLVPKSGGKDEGDPEKRDPIVRHWPHHRCKSMSAYRWMREGLVEIAKRHRPFEFGGVEMMFFKR